MKKLNVLVVGSGGREHALCKKVAESPHLKRLYSAPGNPGIAEIATCVQMPFYECPKSFLDLASGFDLVVIGPERPLVYGLGDQLRACGVRTFGPGKDGARLEGSKIFTKEFLRKCGVATAPYRIFTDRTELQRHLHSVELPKVLKADGLREGKGAKVIFNQDEVEGAIERIFGDGSEPVLIEDFMPGDEISITAVLDGRRVFRFPCSRDYKRARDGDRGNNTGGMGAHSPAYWAFATRETMLDHIHHTITKPVAAGLRDLGIDFRGVLYINVMLTNEGPKVIEINVRFGDPECQVLLARMTSDILPFLFDCAEGNAAGHRLEFSGDFAICIANVSEGYPDAPRPSGAIKNLSGAEVVAGVHILHAGTKIQAGELVPSGGRALNICAIAPSFEMAQRRVYEAMNRIDWPEGYFRTDIGHRYW